MSKRPRKTNLIMTASHILPRPPLMYPRLRNRFQHSQKHYIVRRTFEGTFRTTFNLVLIDNPGIVCVNCSHILPTCGNGMRKRMFLQPQHRMKFNILRTHHIFSCWVGRFLKTSRDYYMLNPTYTLMKIIPNGNIIGIQIFRSLDSMMKHPSLLSLVKRSKRVILRIIL